MTLFAYKFDLGGKFFAGDSLYIICEFFQVIFFGKRYNKVYWIFEIVLLFLLMLISIKIIWEKKKIF
jgi:hypothetical protein